MQDICANVYADEWREKDICICISCTILDNTISVRLRIQVSFSLSSKPNSKEQKKARSSDTSQDKFA